MSDNTIAGFSKDPLAPSHGESLVDQSFQSLKSKEIRDSMSPTEMKFHSMTLNNPNTTGWDVQSSSEVSPDGRRFRAETVATTDGVEHVNGGTAEFKGRNEQQSSAMHEGDDKNFLKKASESSKSHLQEKVVVGDENSGRTEVRTSSSTSTSSSKVIQSSSTNDYDNDQPRQYIMDSNRAPQRLQEPQYRQPMMPQEPQYRQEPQVVHDLRQTSDQSSVRQHYDQHTEQYSKNRHESNTTQNVQTNETLEQNKRYVDMDKASPEYQRHVQQLMAQPGEIISNTVEYPKPNVKMITTVKRLPDGTIVRNKRYETEEPNAAPTPAHVTSTRQTTSNQTNLRRDQPTKNYREPSERAPSERYRQPNDGNVDYIDSRDNKHYTHDSHTDNVHNVETKYSTVKSSNRKFSTETTSEHVEEYDDRHGPTSGPGSRARPANNNSFSTHGFPSVRSNKPTQEFATDRPNLDDPSQNLTTSPRDVPIPVHGEPRKIITERRIPTSDGEVIIVSSEQRRNVKHHTNSERVIETDIRSTDDHRHHNVSDVTSKTTQDFSTHGFPSVREPKSNHPDNRQVWPVGPGHSPRGREEPDSYGVTPTPGENVVISSQKSHTSKHSTNTERIIETEVVGDDGRPRLPAGNMKVTISGHEGQPRSPTGHYTVTTPGTPYMPNTANQDYTTHVYHTVKTPTESKPDYSSQGYPSARPPTRVTPGYAMPKDGNRPRGSTSPTSKKSSTVIETTERVIQKEKEVDAAHRAFAASLRSSSPVDHARRDSCSTDGNRQTPTRTFRRDVREGSHDSAPGSETSRISHTTVTRQTPPKTVGGRTAVVSKQTVVTTKNGSDLMSASSPRASKSPSPGKSVTTTTTTRTVTSKPMPKDVPKSEPSPRSSPAPSSRSSPYPSKSKSPLGEDDQSYYTSRPLSPSSSTRSPKPIGSKDVPNSRDPRPAYVVSDERRTVDRDTVIEETTTTAVVADEEDVDFGQKYTKTTKTLKTQKTDDAPKRGSLKSTNSPQQIPSSRSPKETEELKRPKSTVQAIEKHPARPKSSLPVDERKAQMPKNVAPISNNQSPRKVQPKQGDSPIRSPQSKAKPKTNGERQYPETTDDETTEFTSQITIRKIHGRDVNEYEHETINRQKPKPMETPKTPNKNKPQVPGKLSSTKFIENERKPQTPQKVAPKNVGPQSEPLSRPITGQKPKHYDADIPSDDEPIISDVHETTEITSQITTKRTHGREVVNEFENETIKRQKPQPTESPNTPNKNKPQVPGKVSSSKLIENERKPQTPQKVEPKKVGPQPKPLSRPITGQKPKDYDNYDEHVPSDDEPITSDVHETTKFTSQITTKKTHGREVVNEFENETINHQKPKPMESQNIPNKYKPQVPGKVSTTKLIENERKPQTPQKVAPKNVGPQSKPITGQKPKDYDNYDEQVPSDDELITSGVHETTEFTSQITTKKTHGTEINEYEHETINRQKPQPTESQDIPYKSKPQVPGKVSPTKLIENERKPDIPQKVAPKNVRPQSEPLSRPITGQKPKHYDEHVPSDDEPILSDVHETTEFTSQITTKKIHGREINEYENETINRQKPQPTDSPNTPYKNKPQVPGKVSSTKLIENEQKPQTPQKVVPKNVGPKSKPMSGHIPSDDEPILSDIYETTEFTSQITTEKTHGREVNEYEHEIINRQKPQHTEFQDIPNKYKPQVPGKVSSTKLIENEQKPETPQKVAPKNVGPQSKPLPGPITTSNVPTDDERITSDVYKTTESNVQTIKEETYGMDETYKRPQPIAYQNVPNKNVDETKPKPQQTLHRETDDDLLENNFREISEITVQNTRKQSPIQKDEHPKDSQQQQLKHPSDKLSPLAPKHIEPCVTQTSTITIETTEGDLVKFDEKFKPKSQEPDILLNASLTTRNANKIRNQQIEKDVHEEFIKAERTTHSEIPDGSFISKTKEPVEPKSPTFNKKGVSRRDTFEDRCRQILGMDSYGNTPGTYKPNSVMEPTVPVRKTAPNVTEITQKSVCEVKIEDCGDDEENDEPLTIASVKKTIREKKTTPDSDTEVSDYENSNKIQISTTDKNVDKVFVTTTEKVHIDRLPSKVLVTTTSDSEQETTTKRTQKANKRVEISDVVISNKSGTQSPTRSPLPTKKDIEGPRKDTKPLTTKSTPETKKPTSRTPTKSFTPKDNVSPQRSSSKSPSPTREMPLRTSPKRKPDSSTNPTAKQCTKDENIFETTTIKDRLRSATRKDRTPTRPDQVDANSSPETSPSRYTSRRRSSNISVNTEIIIEHTDSETINKKKDSRTKKQTDSVYREIIDSTNVPEKMPKKMPVTERKESAPVQRVTRKDKDAKMSRSTSENIIKVKKPETSSNNLLPHSNKMSPKSSDQRRPNKCFTTKTINLSTMDHRVTSDRDMENVIIDIQQAKSSREPSPDKIVPTPVPAHFDTGKPRYPDVVQEPEDEPRRRPIIKNIPIFEEENNKYIGCHITEVNIEKSSRKTIDSLDYRDDEILNTPVVEAPLSLDYCLPAEVTDDEYVLSVHDKVSKFQHIAKEITTPKPSTPFNREYDDMTHIPEGDECLLTVDEKVDKFIKTAESLSKSTYAHERDTKRPTIKVTEDQDLDTTECAFTPVKLGPTAPQRSPELVRHISRNISRQSDDDNTQPQQIFESQQEKETIIRRPTGQEPVVTHHKSLSSTPVKPQPVMADYTDDDELIPHTASHTTILEERRQKNILSRPSVFDNNKNKSPTIRKTQPKNVSPVKDSVKSMPINKPAEKLRAKPETAKHSTVPDKTTVTTTKTSVTFGRKQQTPQPAKPDVNDDNRRSSVETSFNSIITKQTQPHSTLGPKKSPQLLNKKPDRHSPLRTNKAKNVDDDDAVDYVDDVEFEVVPCDRKKELIINADTAIRSTTIIKSTDKANVHKEPTHVTNTGAPFATRKMKENQISSTCSSPSSKGTKTHLVDITEKSTQKHNTTTKTTDLNKFSEANESLLEKPTWKKHPLTPLHTKPKGTTTTESVAAKRSLFENKATTNTAASSPGRRPTYMDHTKSSLEHIRRDSLELSKTNFSRKPSTECDDDVYSVDRDTHVKFDVPQKIRMDVEGELKDVDIEEIFDIEILERMLETVTSYEIRRRIRAQIRLVKKNHINVQQNHRETTTKTNGSTKVHDRSDRSPVSSIRETGSKVTTKKQYYYREEERTSSSTHTSPERTQSVVTTKVTRTQSPESMKSTSPSNRNRSSQQKPVQGKPYSRTNNDRSQSPDSTRVLRNERVTSSKHYDYKNEVDEQFESTEKPLSPTPRRSSRKSPSPRSSPERHDVHDSSKSPTRKTPTTARVGNRSPDNKTSSTIKSNSRHEQSITTAAQTKRSPAAPSSPKGKPEQKAPVWADRKNVLKTPITTTTPKTPATVMGSRTSSLNKSIKSTSNQQSQKLISNKSTYVEDDCITSSYGIGPTDENGLPLFGIRALKKKKPTPDSCETTEEITGYVVEEKYYSDNKSKPIVERKEIIYSNNPKELDAIKAKTKETIVKKSQREKLVDNSHQPSVGNSTEKTTTTTLRSSPEDSILETTTRTYVRRGSVKEMSEKFIHKETSSSVNEKSNNYPKAGLILRTNSRQHVRDVGEAHEGANMDTYETRDSEEDNNESFAKVRGSTMHSSRTVADSESASECESMQTQRQIKQTTSSSSRSFLNSRGEEKIITNVTDVLDRMRNADNVVEDGDTVEDQEARAMLNKFLGASIIMKGVEGAIPINCETKTITTTSSTAGQQQPTKREVKTTRVTKTIKSGSSSTPVIETTCDIEEIWDEEILKQLLDQARTYEERRKIRSRLRELMADRQEKKDCQADTNSAAEKSAESASAQRSDSSASEYEEIEEEVTDSSDCEEPKTKEPNSNGTSSAQDSAKPTDHTADTPQKNTEKEPENTKDTDTDSDSKYSAESNKNIENSSETTPSSPSAESQKHTEAEAFSNEETDCHEKSESPKPPSQSSTPQQTTQQTNQTVGDSEIPGSNSPTNSSSDRSMHAPNNKSSSSAQYTGQTPPIVTVTAGRADNTYSGRDISSASMKNPSDVVGSTGRQVDRLGVPQKEDSGTESGEDLRLIAAGLRDQLQTNSDSNIIDDVTFALSRLESSLRDGKGITVDAEKRKALLALVARLQDGLTCPEKLAEIAAAMSELDGNDVLYGETSSPEADAHRSGKQRFAKRRNRVNRHTVGVSREELADARRYMEDMLIMGNISQEQPKSSTSTTEKTETTQQDGAVVTTTTKVTTRTVAGGTAAKTATPFSKFKQLDRQSSQQSTKSPTTPGSGSSASPTATTGNARIFKFTDPALNARAATAKDQLLQWCQSKTTEYENVKITNFSGCWVDGLAFCALIHHFLPDAFDYSQLTPVNRRKNFELAFTVADEKAGIAPLLDVEDMVVMKRPDWKCVFVYVQSIYRRFRNCQ